MGVLSGPATFLRFDVDGEPPKGYRTQYEQAIEARRFTPLSARGEDMVAAGWAPLEAPFDDDAPVTSRDFAFGDVIALCYREDKIALPKPLVRHLTQKRLAELELQGEKITRNVKQTVQLMVLAELRRRVLPRPRVVDVVWDTSRRRVRVFAAGALAKERVSALFERTFDLRLHLADYTRRAFTLDLSKRAQAVLEALGPMPLYEPAWHIEEDDDG